MKFYGYNKCGTCRNAQKWLNQNAVAFSDIDITQSPPTKAQLKAALAAGYELKDLFNRSGVQYRELNMKEKIKELSQAQLIELLVTNGKLVKRPFAIDGKKVTVGFKADVYEETWG